jgi:hypothetical protein
MGILMSILMVFLWYSYGYPHTVAALYKGRGSDSSLRLLILNLKVKSRVGFYPRGRMDMHGALGLHHSTTQIHNRFDLNVGKSANHAEQLAHESGHTIRFSQAPSPIRNPKAQHEHDQQCACNKHRHSERGMFVCPCDAIQRNA